MGEKQVGWGRAARRHISAISLVASRVWEVVLKWPTRVGRPGSPHGQTPSYREDPQHHPKHQHGDVEAAEHRKHDPCDHHDDDVPGADDTAAVVGHLGHEIMGHGGAHESVEGFDMPAIELVGARLVKVSELLSRVSVINKFTTHSHRRASLDA